MFLDNAEYAVTPLGFDNPTWGPTAVLLHPRSMEKLASSTHVPDRILDFMANIRPRDDGRYLLLNALGALEYWGINKNGDGFPEWSLKGEQPPPDVMEFIRSKNLPIPPMWGYRTFETYAYPFRHHNNSDPVHSIGERVCCAAYNDRMHRVELIIFILKSKAEDLIKKIDDGIPIAWSMGAKLLWDVCSICMNAAKNRAAYCDHLKKSLGDIYSDGRKVFAYNYFPRFFDISEVLIPADRSAYSLRKIGSDQSAPMIITPTFVEGPEQLRRLNEPAMQKFAGLLDHLSSGGVKEAEIEKEVPAQSPSKDLGESPIAPEVWTKIFDLVANDRADSEDIPSDTLRKLKECPMNGALQALTSLGIILKRPELDQLTSGKEDGLPESLDFSQPDSTLLMSLKKLVGKRSMFDPHFSMRMLRISKKGGEKPKITLIKKGSGAYKTYKKLLKAVDLEKLAEATAQPCVQRILDPSALERGILELSEPAALSFQEMAAPFIAEAGTDEQ